MNNEFVTYEQALAVKELGFNELCFGYFNSKSELEFNTNGNPISKDWVWFGNQCLPIDMTLAPLKQQVFRCFREKHGLDGFVFNSGDNKYSFNISDNYFLNTTYEEAENACIDKLIELAKQQ